MPPLPSLAAALAKAIPAVETRNQPAYWAAGGPGLARELLEVLLVIVAVTALGWLTPLSYDALGHIYLLTVIVLSLRVSRWPALAAALASALAWNYTFVPPRLSFSKLDLDDSLLLGTYFFVALVASQLTTYIRDQQRTERLRERRATALFELTRALAGARTLDEGVTAALRQADELFEARSALLLPDARGGLMPHPAGSLVLDEAALSLAEWVRRNRSEAGRFTQVSPEAPALHRPLLREGRVLGVLVVRPPLHVTRPPQQRDLVEAFAAQLALLLEREHLRRADERAKLLTESDRLHRTLLDSVSHELRTPLAVLRSAAEGLIRHGTDRRPELPDEILMATGRLDHLVTNLLGQTRLEAGGVKPQLDWCDARDLIAAARRSLGAALEGRAIRLEIPADMPLLVADAPLMEQVITNLLLNAALYSPAGTPLTIMGGLNPEPARVFLTFMDEGPGIPAELRPQLFQKFRRGDSPGGNGLGLGLSIVRGFMQAQGGDVHLEDYTGPGARFTVHLPHRPHNIVPQE